MIKDEGLNLVFLYNNIGNRVKPVMNPYQMNAILETYRQIENNTTHT